METRANYLLIGALTLALLIGGFAFALWLAGAGRAPAFDRYLIYFSGAIDGLGEGSDVRYNGIKVGSVGKITLDKDDPSRVKVEIEVASGTPVRKDTVAKLESQGITGVAYVQMTAGTGASPLLEPGPGGLPPIIPSRTGGLAQVIATLPEVLRSSAEILDQAKNFVGPENQATVARTLANIETVTAAIAEKSGEIQQIIDNVNAVSGSIAEAARAISGITADARAAMEKIGAFASTLSDLVASNRRSIDEFAAEGLTQFAKFITEARRLVGTLERVAERLESDPSRFILGTQRPEYAPQ
ncbi:MlaD family protein [Zavarzinia aquatilis]|uniref:MCE family protein n=1 Tax=Zavarzinia aquatilis TaxID=2211142 RepID=A0A317E901_9PROT|nr:MlaD family protein [Zavarzinia aquatilis]PWR22774.1 MCE family protein [Zavarzinia aquatilis]